MFASNTTNSPPSAISEAIEKINQSLSQVNFTQTTLNEAFALPLIDLLATETIGGYEQTHIPELKAMIISIFTSPHLFQAQLAIQKMQLHILMLTMKYANEALNEGYGTPKQVFKQFADFSKQVFLPCDANSGYLMNENTYQAFWDLLSQSLPLNPSLFMQPFQSSLWSYLTQFDIYKYDVELTEIAKNLNAFSEISDLECKELESIQKEYISARTQFKETFRKTAIDATSLMDDGKPEAVAVSSFLGIFKILSDGILQNNLSRYVDQVFQALVDAQGTDSEKFSFIKTTIDEQNRIMQSFTFPPKNPNRELFGEKIQKAKSLLQNASFENPADYHKHLAGPVLFYQNATLLNLNAVYEACHNEYAKKPTLTPTNPPIHIANTGIKTGTASLPPAPPTTSVNNYDFSDYLKFYKCKLFGTHHKKRMVALSAALYKLNDDAERTQLLERMLALLEGKAFTPEQAIFIKHIDKRWTTQVDKNAVGNYEKSGCYQAILKLRNELNPLVAPRLAPKA